VTAELEISGGRGGGERYDRCLGGSQVVAAIRTLARSRVAVNLHRRHSPDRGLSSTLLSRIAVAAVATVVGLIVLCVVMGAVTGPYLSQPAAARTAAPSAAGVSQMSYAPLQPTLIAVGPSSGTHSRESGGPGSTTTAPRGSTPADTFGPGLGGIPIVALRAYRLAASRADRLNPSCGITWPLLAAIGRVESNHGRFAGAILHADGASTPKIIGIPLDGPGTALIRDTDHGRLDGDVVYDRAVGPMQFIPSTWAEFSVHANGDHVPDPFNIFDAAALPQSTSAAPGATSRPRPARSGRCSPTTTPAPTWTACLDWRRRTQPACLE
jgi:hypothetical protein